MLPNPVKMINRIPPVAGLQISLLVFNNFQVKYKRILGN
jgi:hypothetical protein